MCNTSRDSQSQCKVVRGCVIASQYIPIQAPAPPFYLNVLPSLGALTQVLIYVHLPASMQPHEAHSAYVLLSLLPGKISLWAEKCACKLLTVLQRLLSKYIQPHMQRDFTFLDDS